MRSYGLKVQRNCFQKYPVIARQWHLVSGKIIFFWKQATDFDLSKKVYQANLYSNGGEVHLAYEMENGKPVLTCHTDATGEANLFFEPADLPFTRSGMI